MDLADRSPPPFGHPMRKLFGFQASYTNLNHGSYGSLPLPVMEHCEKLAREAEANPDRFMRETYMSLLNTVRERVAKLVGAQADECVIVPNATHGINTVLRNLIWQSDDVIVKTAVTYPSVSRVIQYLNDVPPHPNQDSFALEIPSSHADIVDAFRAHLRKIPRKPGAKIVAVIDGIIALPGILLPWEDMCRVCKEEGVISVVDAAHCIGQQLHINLKDADPDFWVSNCHKWLYAKRACAVLYVPKRNQHLIKTSLPTSSYYASPSDPEGSPKPPNFLDQFLWTGTLDLTPYLSISPGLDFRRWIGGEAAINEYCHDLAMRGGKRLAEILGTSVLDATGELTANMANVEIPLEAPASKELLSRILWNVADGWNISISPFYLNERWWVRCSAQIFNEMADFERLGGALKVVCGNMNKSLSRL